MLLIGAGFAWVMLGNIARVVTVTYLGTRWGIDVGQGWRHEALSLFYFLLSLALLGSTDYFLGLISESARSWRMRRAERRLRTLTNERKWIAAPEVGPAPDHAGPTLLPDWHRTWLTSWPIVAAFGFLGIVQVALLWPSLAAVRFFDVAVSPIVSRFHASKVDDLPAQWGPFRRSCLFSL